jgi:hypothetical protein
MQTRPTVLLTSTIRSTQRREGGAASRMGARVSYWADGMLSSEWAAHRLWKKIAPAVIMHGFWDRFYGNAAQPGACRHWAAATTRLLSSNPIYAFLRLTS